MTKQYPLIKVQDGYVVVDKETPIIAGKDKAYNEVAPFGFDCAYSISKENPFVNGTNVFKGIHKIIAHSGIPSLKDSGLPLIDLQEEDFITWLLEKIREMVFAGFNGAAMKQGGGTSSFDDRDFINRYLQSLNPLPKKVWVYLENGVPLVENGYVKVEKWEY